MSKRIATLAVLVLLLTIAAFAQNNTGIISGKIVDPTGAVVPNAQITVTQADTGVDSASESNSEGLFRVPGLRDGPYRVAVTATGFKRQVREGFDLHIGQVIDVEMRMEVGAATESVTVVSSIPLLDSQTSSTGQVMEGDYFYELPNYQHWEKGVLYYTPQVQSNNAPWPGSLQNWNINGGNSYQIATYEDGMLSTSMDGNTTINSVSVGDEEIKVVTSAMPAEYGHATAGAMIVVKKGGANQFHGEGGELFKNNAMYHRRFFQDKTNTQAGVQDLFQQPDFVLSGPVVIPHVYNGKNKTFFEIGGSYHIDSSSNASTYWTPTSDMLGGNFSVLTNQIYDPASTSGTFAASNLLRTPFPGNVIPTSRFSSMWNAIAANKPFAAPQPGIGGVTNNGPLANIATSGSGNYYNLTNQVRIDHSFTEKLKIMGSVTWGNQHQPANNVNILYKPYDQYQVLTYTVQNVGAINLTYTVTPHLISETRIGEYRRTGNPRSLTGTDYTFAIAKAIPNLPSNVYVNPISFGPGEGSNGSSQLGVGTLSVSVNNNHQFNQDFTMVKGKHAIKFGYEWLWENQVSHNIGNARLQVGFGGSAGGYGNGSTANGMDTTQGLQGNGNAIPNTGGVALANLMLGYVSQYTYLQQGASLLPVDSNHSFYVQDDWRLLPNLTLNLGLRYENETPAHSKFPGQLSVGSLTVPDNYYPSGGVAGLLTCPAGGCMGAWTQPKGFLWNRDNTDFQPRFGLAWTVRPDTVVRAGFAWMTLDWNLGYTNQSEIGGANFYNQAVTPAPNTYTPLFNINQGIPAFVSVAQLPNGSIPTSASSPSARPTITVVPANFHHPYTLNWNISIQHQLKKNYMLELSYVGLHNIGFSGNYNWESRPYGTGIDASGNVIDLRQQANWAYRNNWVGNTSGVNGTQAYKPFPSLGGVNYQCNCVRMIYHSGTVKLQKRFADGLTFLTFFTFQKGIQNSPGNLYLDQQEQRAVTGLTNKYRYVSSMTYELPLGKGKRWLSHGRVMDYIFGGYSFAWNFSVWAPLPASIGYSGGTYLNPATGATGSRQDYPNYEPLPGGSIYLTQDPKLRSNWQDVGTYRMLQTAQNPTVTNCGTTPIFEGPNNTGPTWGNLCEVVAPSFTNGNLPGNMWLQQRIIGANASMYKDFRIKERFKAQLRLDFFNPFKWFNWSQNNTTMTQTNPSTFMTPGTGENGDSTEGGPSELQLSFRIRF
jgi:hypothetical protein